MSALAMQSFGFGDQLVRVADKDGAAWFVANDVCRALEIANPRDAVKKLDEDEKGVVSSDTLGGRQDVTIISESGVYTLIFKSRKPSAVAFRKWVTADVLPTLRRTGRFEMAAENDDPAPTGVLAFGSPQDLARLQTALIAVREARHIFGANRAAFIWEKIGLPVPPEPKPLGLPAPPEAGSEGPLFLWASAVGLIKSRQNAMGLIDLYERYEAWCLAKHYVAATRESFLRGMRLGYGEPEGGVLFRVKVTRSWY
jgi:prophage antirepressor-like protein